MKHPNETIRPSFDTQSRGISGPMKRPMSSKILSKTRLNMILTCYLHFQQGITYKSVSEMNLLDMCTQESLRMYPPVIRSVWNKVSKYKMFRIQLYHGNVQLLIECWQHFYLFVLFTVLTEYAARIQNLVRYTYPRVWSSLHLSMLYIMIRRSGQSLRNSTLIDSLLKRRPNIVLMTGCHLVQGQETALQ